MTNVLRLSFRYAAGFAVALCGYDASDCSAADTAWKRHVVWQGGRTNTAVGGDFTGDGLPDVVCTTGGITRLLVAPEWRAIELESNKQHNAIHAESFDVDADGDLDYIGAQY